MYRQKDQGGVYTERLKESKRGRELLKRMIQKEEPWQGTAPSTQTWLTHDCRVCKGEGPALYARHCSLGRFKLTEGRMPQAWIE